MENITFDSQKEGIKMNKIKEKLNIKDMIHEIRGKQVMLDSEISATKCHGIIYQTQLLLNT